MSTISTYVIVRFTYHIREIMGKNRKTWEQDGENKAITHPGRAPSLWWYNGRTIRNIDARTRYIIESQPDKMDFNEKRRDIHICNVVCK